MLYASYCSDWILSRISLETEAAENVIKENKAKDGAEGYSMQYHALLDILNRIGLA